jgi:hypothetical protein
VNLGDRCFSASGGYSSSHIWKRNQFSILNSKISTFEPLTGVELCEIWIFRYLHVEQTTVVSDVQCQSGFLVDGRIHCKFDKEILKTEEVSLLAL